MSSSLLLNIVPSLEGISRLKPLMNYSWPLVNWEHFSNFRCFMHKTLECRQRQPGKTKIIFSVVCWELTGFVAAVHHLILLPACLLCPPALPCLAVPSLWWFSDDSLTCQACRQASGIRYLCLIPARFSPSLSPCSFPFSLYCRVECSGWWWWWSRGWEGWGAVTNSSMTWSVCWSVCDSHRACARRFSEFILAEPPVQPSVSRQKSVLSFLSTSSGPLLPVPSPPTPCGVCIPWSRGFCGVCSFALEGTSHVTGSLPHLATFRLN